MLRPFQHVVHLLQLMRVAQVFAAISNGWLIVFLSRIAPAPSAAPAAPVWAEPAAVTQFPLGLALLLVAVIATGLHVYGAALNDVIDARHDRLFSPDRPIAAGRMARTPALVLSVLCLLAALAAAVLLGEPPALLCLLVAGVILFYDTAGKFLPATGIITLAVIRALFMFVPNPTFAFVWPIWVMLTHLIVWMSIAYQLQSKRPRLHSREWSGLCLGWMFWTMALVGWMTWQHRLIWDGRPWLWVGPAAAAVGFIPLAWWTMRPRPNRSRRAAGKALFIRCILWLIVYDAGWLLAAGEFAPGLLHLALFAVAWGCTTLVNLLASLNEPKRGYVVGGRAAVE
jgi:4-hydroxybenzoate polyprenyltransferase